MGCFHFDWVCGKNKHFVFLIFNESLFEVNHWLMFSNSWFSIWYKYLISLCVKISWCHKSFTYKRNRSGPKSSLHWSSLFHWSVWIVPYMTGSFWPIYDFCPLYHIVPIFLRRMELSTVLKASDKSMNTPSAYLLFSKDPVIWSTNRTTVWSVEWPFWKPNCLECKILFSIKYFREAR